jgi:hypothetical protein
MYVCSPVIFFLSVLVFCSWLFLTSPLLLFCFLIIFIGAGVLWRQNLVFAFVLNQFYLLAGLANLGKDMRVWESTSAKKQ